MVVEPKQITLSGPAKLLVVGAADGVTMTSSVVLQVRELFSAFVIIIFFVVVLSFRLAADCIVRSDSIGGVRSPSVSLGQVCVPSKTPLYMF